MTLTLDITLELEAQLRREAAQEGLDETGRSESWPACLPIQIRRLSSPKASL